MTPSWIVSAFCNPNGAQTHLQGSLLASLASWLPVHKNYHCLPKVLPIKLHKCYWIFFLSGPSIFQLSCIHFCFENAWKGSDESATPLNTSPDDDEINGRSSRKGTDLLKTYPVLQLLQPPNVPEPNVSTGLFLFFITQLL